MFPPPIVWLTASLLTGSPVEQAPPEVIRQSIEKVLPLLVKGAEGHADQKTCFACHNQGVPMLAFAALRERGFAVSEELLENQVTHILSFLDGNRENYRKGKGTGGQADTAGYALLALERGGHKPDETTAAVVEYLLQFHKDLDHWRTTSSRPPSEASSFTTTYLALRGLQTWGTPEQQERIAKRVATVRAWVLKTPAKDTEDRVFRLLGLHLLKADDTDVQEAVEELLAVQGKDGGWAQLPARDSDAYATGSALVALHQAGGLAITDPAFQRGVGYLVRSQRADGSWFVPSRSRPFQPYYESGFPHGKDQFISMAASAWAATALTLATPARQ